MSGDLKEKGFNVWIDQMDIPAGSVWDLEVQKALNDSDCVIIILSKASVVSENVLDEVSYALKQKKHVYPILKDDCEIPFRLDRIQRIDFRNNYDTALNKLANALDRTDYPSAETAELPIKQNRLKKLLPFLIGGILLLAVSIFFIVRKSPDDIHGYVTIPVKNDPGKIAADSATSTAGELFTTADYKGRYEIKNNDLIIYVFCKESFPRIDIDVNQNKIIDAGYDRAYGIQGGTINGICTSFILSATSFTPCGGAPSRATLNFLDNEYSFILPLKEITSVPKAKSVSFQVAIYTRESNWVHFPSTKDLDFTQVYSVTF